MPAPICALRIYRIVQYVPAWFPGAKFKRIARVYHKSVMAMLNEPFDLVRRKLVCFSIYWLL